MPSNYQQLELLLGSYFHQDYLDITGDEVETVEAFCLENPGQAAVVVKELRELLRPDHSETDLAAFADKAGCAIDPRFDGGTYRQWFTEIEAQARAYAAEHPEA